MIEKECRSYRFQQNRINTLFLHLSTVRLIITASVRVMQCVTKFKRWPLIVATKQSLSSGGNNLSAIQNFPHFTEPENLFWSSENPSTDLYPSQMNPLNIISFCFFKICSNILARTLTFSKWFSFSSRIKSMHVFLSMRTTYLA